MENNSLSIIYLALNQIARLSFCARDVGRVLKLGGESTNKENRLNYRFYERARARTHSYIYIYALYFSCVGEEQVSNNICD